MAKATLNSLSSEFEGLLDGEIGNRVIEKKVKEIVFQPREDSKGLIFPYLHVIRFTTITYENTRR